MKCDWIFMSNIESRNHFKIEDIKTGKEEILIEAQKEVALKSYLSRQ